MIKKQIATKYALACTIQCVLIRGKRKIADSSYKQKKKLGDISGHNVVLWESLEMPSIMRYKVTGLKCTRYAETQLEAELAFLDEARGRGKTFGSYLELHPKMKVYRDSDNYIIGVRENAGE